MVHGMKYYAVHKPFGVLCQFTREVAGQQVLSDFFDLKKDIYPVGRLDKDSEGLLLLTNDKSLNSKLLDPKHAHSRTYFAQVEGVPTPEALLKLAAGVSISVEGKLYKTRPCTAEIVEPNPPFSERTPPIRVRKSIPDCWVKLTLKEGKNRQVRKMCAAVGYPVLRLIRVGIEDLQLDGLSSGDLRELNILELKQLLKLE